MRNGMSTNVETNNTRITAVSAIPRRRERNSLSGLCATEFLSRESQKYRANKQPIKGSATIYSSRDLIRKSEEHTYELQSLMRILYAVFCLKKKKQKHITNKH